MTYTLKVDEDYNELYTQFATLEKDGSHILLMTYPQRAKVICDKLNDRDELLAAAKRILSDDQLPTMAERMNEYMEARIQLRDAIAKAEAQP